MSNTIEKVTATAAEAEVMKRGYRFIGAYVASDTQSGIPYSPDYEEGDLLVTLIGGDPGSVSWTENWGNIDTFCSRRGI